MKHQLTHHSSHLRLLAMLILVLALVSCDNQVNVSPTAPRFSDMNPTVGALRTLSISGTLISEQGSCLKATILFNGEEIDGARSRCHKAQGCAELQLAGAVSTFAGHHTITFRVLQQSAETDEYLAAGSVAVSRVDVQLFGPVVLNLETTRASLQSGEGVTFDLALWD